MPKRKTKGGKRKRKGGSKFGREPALFTSTAGAVPGTCTGCDGNGTNKTLVGGGLTTSSNSMLEAAKNGQGFGRVPQQSLKFCGVPNPQAMGAGIPPKLKLAQSGGGPSECVDGCNQFGPAGYGLNRPGTSDNNALLKGSGYPVVSSYNSAKRCTKGGRKRRRGKRKTRRKRNKRKTRKRRRKRRGGGVSRSMKVRQFANKIGALGTSSFKGGRRKRKGGKRKTMKGGYHQYGSNNPTTPGLRLPNPGNLPWATGPLSKTRQINCNDNYNHYSGKGSLSPVLDGDVA